MQQPARADDTSGDGTLVCQFLDNLLLHFLTDVFVVNHTKGVRQNVGCHGIIAIECAVRIKDMTGNLRGALLYGEECAVEGLLGEASLVGEPSPNSLNLAGGVGGGADEVAPS